MPEILLEDVLISSFAITDDMIIFSKWDDSKIFIYSMKTKKVEVLCEYEDYLSCSSISFLKSEGIKFLFVVLSNGKMLFYKLKSTVTINSFANILIYSFYRKEPKLLYLYSRRFYFQT